MQKGIMYDLSRIRHQAVALLSAAPNLVCDGCFVFTTKIFCLVDHNELYLGNMSRRVKRMMILVEIVERYLGEQQRELVPCNCTTNLELIQTLEILRPRSRGKEGPDVLGVTSPRMCCKSHEVGGQASPTVTNSPAIPNTEDYNTDYHTSTSGS